MPSIDIMIRAIFAVLLLNLASHAAAQDDDSPYYNPAFSQLPADLKSYLSSVATNTAIAAAIVGDYITEPEVLSDGRRGPAYSQVTPFIQGAQSRFQSAATATALPDDAKSILVSIAHVISVDAATDGLLGNGPASAVGQTSMATVATPTSDSARSTVSGGSVSASATATASVGASSGTVSGTQSISSSKTQASPSPTSNGAAIISSGTISLLCGLQILMIRILAAFI